MNLNFKKGCNVLADSSLRLEQFSSDKYSVLRLNNWGTIAQRIKNYFTCSVNRNSIGWQYACMDFITYENYYNRRVIAFLTQEQMEEIYNTCNICTFNDPWLREHEPKVIVHSTSFEAYSHIMSDGSLQSFSKLSVQLSRKIGLGYYLLREPEDYADYVMLCGMNDPVGELVVATRERGEYICDSNTFYTPGARLYFDAEKLAGDGGLVRDGTHYKVKEQLPLNRYLLLAVTSKELSGCYKGYSVKDFIEFSNQYFLGRNTGKEFDKGRGIL